MQLQKNEFIYENKTNLTDFQTNMMSHLFSFIADLMESIMIITQFKENYEYI